MDVETSSKKFESFAREYGARFIVIYGSRANERATFESDVDIGVFFDRGYIPEDLLTYADIVSRLAELCAVSSQKIDFVALNRANILLRQEIMSKGKLLYGDADAYEQYRAFAFREYCDAKRLFALEDFLIRKRQRLLKQVVTNNKT